VHCSRCGLQISPEDNFCRKCGAAVDIIDVPAVRGESRAPSIWEGAKPALARGVILVATGAVLRFLVGRGAKVLLSRALSDGDDGMDLRRLTPFGGNPPAKRGGEELEILWYRRVRH
jgi:hypothetical protein